MGGPGAERGGRRRSTARADRPWSSEEAAMVDDRDVADLLTTAAEYGVKVVEIGDWAQLKAIGVDGGFKRAHEIVDGLELSENRRQKDTRNGPRWRRGWTAAAVPRCRCSPSTAASTRSVRPTVPMALPGLSSPAVAERPWREEQLRVGGTAAPGRRQRGGDVGRGTSAGERSGRARCRPTGWRHQPQASWATSTPDRQAVRPGRVVLGDVTCLNFFCFSGSSR
ncbi:AAA family ATPase [Streptomyces umbrinus]